MGNRYYKDRFLAQRRLARATADLLEVNHILETMRAEIRNIIPHAMETCILLTDPEAVQYTRPLQCGLYQQPVNCISCKRERPAIRQATTRKKAVVVQASPPVIRPDGQVITVGPEIAMPAFANGQLVAVLSTVLEPGRTMTRREFLLSRDVAETVGHVILRARKYWAMTQEKLRLSNVLSHLEPFVPTSVRRLVEDNPEEPDLERQEKDVTVLFLDLEGYTRLSAERPSSEVGRMVERLFSAFIDPIHRYGGDINETAGDGLMIIFNGLSPQENAVNAVSAALDIQDRIPGLAAEPGPDFPPLVVNMGIASGRALLGMARFAGASQTRTTYTATGEVTNLAARLAGAAVGGDVLIGPATRELIGQPWPVFDRGDLSLKGMPRPVKAHSLCRPAAGLDRCELPLS